MRAPLLGRIGRREPAAPQLESPWDAILAAGLPARETGAGGTRVLCATSVGGAGAIRTIDSLVAMALWLRGANPELLLCDGALPACEVCRYVEFPRGREFARHGPRRRLCGPCYAEGSAFYAPLPLPVRRYRQFLHPGDDAAALEHVRVWPVEECFTFEHAGLRLGEQARAGVLRFFGKASLEEEPKWLVDAAARRYAAGALLAARVAERVLEELRPDCIVAHHGVYVPQGVLGEVARREGVRVVNWGPSYRNTTVIYSHRDTYHRTLMAEPAELWDRPLTPREEEELLVYLAARREGKGDWTWVTPEAALRPEIQQREVLTEELGLSPTLPTFGLLTNVLWDAVLYYEGHAFDDMLEWLWATLDFFVGRPDLQLIVRIHPHEVKSGNRQPVGPEIVKRYPQLPATIKIIPHDHPYNTYALMSLCRAVLIYGTKTGVELAPLGMPVVVAGDAWIRGKGLTRDVRSHEEYLEVLGSLASVAPLDSATIDRARSYAYHYFFRRMIPLSAMDPDGPDPQLRIRSADEILPGRDSGLDVICAGVLTGAPFVFSGS